MDANEHRLSSILKADTDERIGEFWDTHDFTDFDNPDLPDVVPETNEMLPEYDFDYQKARPNRYAAQIEAGGLLVVLDPDIAEVFKTSDAVNQALRALITAMPPMPAYG